MSNQVEENTDAVAARVREIVEEVISGDSLYVVELNVRGRKGSQAVDIFIDGDEGVDVQTLARVNREVSFMLETEELIKGGYNLNVSSPGVDRPLTVPRQYRKNVGRQLQVHYEKQDGSGHTEVTGELKAADEEAIEIAASKKDTRRIPYENIVWAKVRLPW